MLEDINFFAIEKNEFGGGYYVLDNFEKLNETEFVMWLSWPVGQILHFARQNSQTHLGMVLLHNIR